LLERAVDGIAGELRSQAEGFVGLLAECARQAGIVQPLDTDGLAELADLVGDQFTTSHNDTSALVTTDQRQLGGDGPVAVDSVEIGVADARVLDVDEDLLRAWLCDGDLLVLEGAADLVDDLSPLLRGDLVRHFSKGGKEVARVLLKKDEWLSGRRPWKTVWMMVWSSPERQVLM
jgi:hypothetical protein